MNTWFTILAFIGLALLITPFIALSIALKASRRVRELQTSINILELQIYHQRRPIQPVDETDDWNTTVEQSDVIPPLDSTESPVIPPPIPNEPSPTTIAWPEEDPEPPVFEARQSEAPTPAESTLPAFSLEQFMGVKLFAWLGGIAMFFGVVFFVKYAFERDLIPAAVRIALGFATGTGLLIGGLWIHRKQAYQTLAHVLSATGILILYGVTFAAHALYHFDAFSQPVTFLLMGLITATAFLLAIRLNAQVVAALGILGGFMSPILLSTGVDRAIGLFTYIAILDVGILATTRIKHWKYLPAAAAVGTIILQIGWFAKFFHSGAYDQGSRTLIPMAILLFFACLFTLAAWIQQRKRPDDAIPSASALALALVAMGYGFVFLHHHAIGQRPFLLYGFILLLNAVPLAISTIERRFAQAHLVAAILTFIHLAVWTDLFLNAERIFSGLAIYLAAGAIHACYPLVRPQFHRDEDHPLDRKTSPWFAPATLLLVLLAVRTLGNAPMLLWAAVLVIDAMAIGLAFKTRRIAPILGSLVLTFVIALTWLGQIPPITRSLAPLLTIVMAFGGLFAITGMGWIRLASAAFGVDQRDRKIDFNSPELLVALSAVLPYGMLILMLHKLNLGDPTPVFGAALALTVLLLGLMLIAKRPMLVPVALLCTLAVEHAWHTHGFRADTPWTTLVWYLAFHAIFTAFPLMFRNACGKHVAPWAGSAISGIGHFLLVQHLVRQGFSGTMGGCMGLVPFAFAIPNLFALRSLMTGCQTIHDTHHRQLAWVGGVALLFITLIFPIQLSRQWITVSWALEGAALVWLFRKVPHDGLKWTAIGLITTAFVRLSLNPTLFEAFPRGGTPLFNWHVYTYGIVIVSAIASAKWLPTEHQWFRRIHLGGLLYGFAGILLFLLLNIEIADFFTPTGHRAIAFQFGGNFARDMTYSISWGLFSLGLLGIGMYKQTRIPRFAAIALLAMTLLKLFLHDLSQIGNIYRIGALMGVAVIAFVASFLYQRFYSQTIPSEQSTRDAP